MILHTVVLYHREDRLDAIVEDTHHKAHRIEYRWKALDHRLPGDWFASVVGEVNLQVTAAVERERGIGRLF
jgi:hypothetical protein